MKPRATAAPAIARDPAALAGMVRKDTSVSADVRDDIAPCDSDDDAGAYPLDTDSGDLTSGDGPDLVVNITTCGDGLGIASYVYRMIDGKYQNVFADERSPVYGSVENGRLQIIHEVDKTDDPAYPTGEEIVTYAWRGDRFVQVSRVSQDFGGASPSASPEPTSTVPVPLPSSGLLDPDLPGGSTPAGRATAPVTTTPAVRGTAPAGAR
jgi:hypothetical protein